MLVSISPVHNFRAGRRRHPYPGVRRSKRRRFCRLNNELAKEFGEAFRWPGRGRDLSILPQEVRDVGNPRISHLPPGFSSFLL